MAGAQLSLGGMRWTSTDIRVDGVQSRNMLRAGEANGGPSSIPLDAVREFEVNTYRSARHRFRSDAEAVPVFGERVRWRAAKGW